MARRKPTNRRACTAPTTSDEGLAAKVVELEALVVSAQDFWRNALATERDRHRAAMAGKDEQIRALQKRVKDYEDRATRRDAGAPNQWRVRTAWRAAHARGLSVKEADFEVSRAFACSERAVQRLLARTDVLLADSMGITVERLRAIQRRPSPHRESSDT